MSAPRRPDRWSDTTPEGAVMIIDCDSCVVRGAACADCVVTVLLGAPPVAAADGADGVDLDGAERAAIAVLAESGLVPPLRLLRPQLCLDARAAQARSRTGPDHPGGPAQGQPGDPAQGQPGDPAQGQPGDPGHDHPAARMVNGPSPSRRRSGARRAAG
jgi:hypothetical protein